MKKSLGRAFIFSLIVFLALNFLFFIIGYSIAGLIEFQITQITDHPTYCIYRLVYPSGFFPWNLLDPRDAPFHHFQREPLYYIGCFISFVLAAIIAGLTGGDIGKSFGGWFLTIICCILLYIVAFSIDDYIIFFYCGGCNIDEAIVEVIIAGVVNLLIFGIIVLLIALIKSFHRKKKSSNVNVNQIN